MKHPMRMTRIMHISRVALSVLLATLIHAGDAPATATMRLTTDVLHPISPLLFGHFMERASWGEPGYEAARAPGSRSLDPRAVAIMKDWRIPLIRFPAGTDLSWIDWRDMVDNVPGRAGGRPEFVSGHPNAKGPLSNAFGIDEFLALCRELDAAPLLPVPLEPGLGKWIAPEELALRNAGLVAYCNAAPGARLPAGMPDWGAVRAANGHPEPYRVRYFQLGNEIYTYWDRALEKAGLATADLDTRYAWYRRVLDASIDAMRAVDPSIELIMEGGPASRRVAGENDEFQRRLLSDAALQARVPWATYHHYSPWGIKQVTRGGQPVAVGSLSAAEIWHAWAAAGPGFDADGQSAWNFRPEIAAQGWRLAVTEWNWNGWWTGDDEPALNSLLAKGVGAAGMLHALMRQPRIGLACQSLLVGRGWPIAGIFYGKDGTPKRMPTGQVVGLYANHHGDRVVRLERAAFDGYAQPLAMGWMKARERVAYLDAVCTMDDGAFYLHLVNRRFDRAERLDLDLSACGALRPVAEHHILEGTLDNSPVAAGDPSCARVRRAEVAVAGPRLAVDIPERTVSVLVLRRR